MREFKLSDSNLDVINLVRKIDKFKEFEKPELLAFLQASRIREYQENETIISEGAFDCWVFFLIQGVLSIEKENHRVGISQRCGDMFGEMGVIDGSPRSATIRAKSKALLLGIDASIVDNKLKDRQINFCYIIYRIFSEVLAVRLRDTTKENIKLQEENATLKRKLAMQ